jgi:hypothetical protein
LFTIGAVLVLVGMVYTSYLESTDTRVLVTLCVGFAFIIAFGCWERFSKVRFPLCPNEIFVSHHGREFTVPFCLTFIVVGFFYGMAIIYPTMLSKSAYHIINKSDSDLQMPFTSMPRPLLQHSYYSRFPSTSPYPLDRYCSPCSVVN